jgi:hypothetical protein
MPPSSLQNHKTIHQRNKSSPALNMMAQNGKTGVRRAFGDVSNTKGISRDDSALVGKPTALPEKGGLAQPAQRQIPLAVTKGLVEKVAVSKPMNPAGKAQPPYKTTKRNNTIFKDQLQPVPEKDSSKENNRVIETVPAPTKLAEANVITKEAEKAIIAPEPYKPLTVELPSHIESDATISEPEDIKEVHVKEPVSAVSEPEEYWDEDETQYYAAPTYPSRGDNTTGGTAVIYPKMNAMTKRQMFQARDIVESQLTEEDIIEDQYDTTMVAEYNDDIFLHLRRKEVCFRFLQKRI